MKIFFFGRVLSLYTAELPSLAAMSQAGKELRAAARRLNLAAAFTREVPLTKCWTDSPFRPAECTVG